jgi:putative mRNA 3-end processing factor
MSDDSLLRLTSAGLYCARGGFHIDPWSPVACAVVTHAHGDHAVKGSRKYLAAEPGRLILQHRMGPNAQIQSLPYGQSLDLNGVRVSLHPAGHVLGSAQVRVEHKGETWVFSGDYKVAPDVTCDPFEPVKCDTFITESTFGHPRYHWDPQSVTYAAIHDWWRENQATDRASLLYAYSLGKAQRLLAGLDSTIGPICVHPAIEQMNELYRQSGSPLPVARALGGSMTSDEWSRSLILMPPAARWEKGLHLQGQYATAFASGWMVLPNEPAKRGVERGFPLSDHADFSELLSAASATEAQRILVTHGYIDEFVATLISHGFHAEPHKTPRCKRPPSVDAVQGTEPGPERVQAPLLK